MAFANPNITDLMATTIEARQKKLSDNVSKNNALLDRLSKKGRSKAADGGTKVIEELNYGDNTNTGWYDGYDVLPTAPQEVISAAEFAWKQAATAVVVSGKELLINSGRERTITLIDGRLDNAEKNIKNLLAGGVYADGTGSAGKQLAGLSSFVVTAPTAGSAGGIPRTGNAWWQNALVTGTLSTNILTKMNELYLKLVRGVESPDLILFDNVFYGFYLAALQPQQRFTDPKMADAGFVSLKFMNADVVLDGGIGGFCPASTGFFLNSDYLRFRPHKDRNFVPLSPTKRYSVNQDAEVQLIGWMGAMTFSSGQVHGRLTA